MRRKPVKPFEFHGMQVYQDWVNQLYFKDEYNEWVIRYSTQFYNIELSCPWWTHDNPSPYVIQGAEVDSHVTWRWEFNNFTDRYHLVTKYRHEPHQHLWDEAERSLKEWLDNFPTLIRELDEYISKEQWQ